MTKRPPATSRSQNSSSQKSNDPPEPMISRIAGSLAAPSVSTHRSTPFTRMPLRLPTPRELIAPGRGATPLASGATLVEMPTTRPRYTFTDTGELRDMLDLAERVWPDITDRKELLYRLART